MTQRSVISRWPQVGAIIEVAREVWTSWREDRTMRLGAGLAYYALFTIVPFFALTAAFAERFFGSIDMASYLTDRLEQVGIVNADLAGESIATELTRRSTTSTLGLIGVASLLFASSLVFLALVDAINTMWNVPVRSGLRNTVQRRLVSFLMVFTTGAALVATLVVSTVSGAVERLVPGTIEIVGPVATLLGWLASASALAVVLALLFRFIGPVRTPWVPTVGAAAATALLMVIGAQAISWYLTTFGGSSLGGAFGALLVLLSWVYYEAQILLAGVQLVKVLTVRRG